jgi:hypothetical protein
VRVSAIKRFYFEVVVIDKANRLNVYDDQGNIVDSFARPTIPGAYAAAELAGYVTVDKGTPLDEALNRYPDEGQE